MNRIKNKKAIVIGGTSGIGKAIVEKFSTEGADVVFCGRSRDKGQEIITKTSNTEYIYCDIKNKNDVKRFFDQAISKLGGMDIAVNNAGISGNPMPFHETSDVSLHDVMEVNFFGLWDCLQHEIMYFLSHEKAGSIVNISSTSGFIGNSLGLTPYSASKHAVIGLTKSVALEYAQNNIRINAVCPGFVDTPMIDNAAAFSQKLKRRIPLMHPVGRVGTTEEIANAVLYLSSDESTFTTGSSLVVDGGLSI